MWPAWNYGCQRVTGTRRSVLLYFYTSSSRRALALWLITALLPFSCSGRSKLARNHVFNTKEQEEIVPGPEQGETGPWILQRIFSCTDWIENNYENLYSTHFLNHQLSFFYGLINFVIHFQSTFLYKQCSPKYFAQGLTDSRDRPAERLTMSRLIVCNNLPIDTSVF